MLAVTIDSVPGYEIVAVIGDVVGACARPQNAFLESVREMPARIQVRPDALRQWRGEAIANMTVVAQQRGANAVVGMRFDHRTINSTWTEICAYGTAVYITPVEG